PHRAHAWPAGVIRNESRVPAEIRVGVGVTEQEPFDELSSRRIVDRLLDGACPAKVGLARQLDPLLDGRKVAGQLRRRGRSLIAGWCRFVRCGGMRCMLV